MSNLQLLELQNPMKTQIVTNNPSIITESVANNLATLSDKDLLALCRKYGAQAILWKRKFIGLLPEVDRRELYLKKGCSSVYEFAAKFGGVTNEQVKRVISIDKKLAELGLFELRSKLINGEVSLNKLARIVSVANGENEKDMLKAVNDLSNRALEVFIKDGRNNQMKVLVGDFGGDFPDGRKYGEDMFVHVHKQDYEISRAATQVGGGREEVKAGLQDLQELGLSARVVKRLKGLKAQGRDINKVMDEMLDKREEEIIEDVEKMSEETVKKEEVKRENGEEVRRYVPADVKKVIEKRGGDKCEVKGCAKPAKHLHHTIRFGIQKSHDPRYMVQLCAEHHQITHVMDEVYLEKRRKK